MFKLRKERIGEQKIDSGNFGHVFPYQRDKDDLKWVVKRIHANDTDEVLKSLPEIVLGFSCDHPCIVPLKGYHIEKGPVKDYYVYLKFPRMKGNLEDRFKEQVSRGHRFSEQEIVEYFYSLVCAVDYLHGKKIYHRDIKPDNILLDDQGKAKLSDIGLAKFVGEDEAYQKLSGKDGALFYTAPEILKEREKLTKESLKANDVWSLGLVMLELCLLEKRPFSPYAFQGKILEDQKDLKRKLKGKYEEKLVDLIFGLLRLDPNERMKIAEVKKKLEEEYSYCKSFEKNLEKDESYLFKEKEESYKKVNKEMMALVESLQQENLKLQIELKEYQSSVKNVQSQISPDVSKLYFEIIERLRAKNQSLMSEAAQKSQELEKIKNISPKLFLSIKALLIGADDSGKHSFLDRLIEERFILPDPKEKLYDMKQKTLTQGKVGFKIHFWKSCHYNTLAGYEKSWITASTVLIAIYDISDKQNFSNIKDDIASYFTKACPIVFLIGSKSDLEIQRQVTKLEAELYAESIGAIHLEVSAKTGENFLEFKEELKRALLADPTCASKVLEKKAREKKSSFWGLK